MTPDQLDNPLAADEDGRERKDGMTLALDALSYKERTEGELISWLSERGVEGDELADVIDRLISSGVLDDEHFARRYAEDKRSLKGWGSDRIREALLARGVETGLIDLALREEHDGAELDRALGALGGRPLDLSIEGDRKKALGLLARRGFSIEVSYDAVRIAERRRAEGRSDAA